MNDPDAEPYIQLQQHKIGTTGHLRFEYLPHVGANRRWSDEKQRSYLELGAVAASIARPESLDFVRRLPGLLSFRINLYDVGDDTPVFDVPSLQQLHLLDKCRRPLRAEALSDLRDLMIDDRPGLDSVSDHQHLRRLTVYGFRQQDVSWLGHPIVLRELHLVGRRQRVSLDGLPASDALRVIQLQDVVVEDLAPIVRCPGLEWLTVEGTKEETVDLAPLAHATALRAVTVQEVGRVRHAACLLDLPYLEQVNFWGTREGLSAELSGRLDRHTSESLERNRTSVDHLRAPYQSP